MISTVAPVTGIPPALTIGSFGLNVVSGTVIVPVSVRSTNTTWVGALALSTACTTIRGVVLGTVTVPRSQAAAAAVAPSTSARPARRSKANRDTGRRQKGELRDRL